MYILRYITEQLAMKCFVFSGYNQVQGLQVKCNNVVNGCRWTGSLSALQNHLLEECRKVYIFCPKGCSNNNKFVKVLRKNMQRHLEYRCPKREQPDVVPIPYYRQRSFSDSQSEQELEKQQPGHLQESSLSDSSVSVEESTVFLKSGQELTLVCVCHYMYEFMQHISNYI